MLKDFTFCIPEWWFTRNGVFWARTWKLEVQVVDDVQGSSGRTVRLRSQSMTSPEILWTYKSNANVIRSHTHP